MATSLTIRRATKTQSRLRMTIDGPAGSGKTYTALVAAFAMAGDGGKVLVVDTERGTASKFVDQFPPYDTMNLEEFSPNTYTEALGIAGEANYDVCIVDSLSHAWEGEGGALDIVDKMKSRGGGNSMSAWKDVTPMHRRMVDALLRSPCHIIATMRSKMEYVLEPDEKGRVVPRKIGMAPIQRQGMEYEFDIVIDMDVNHKAVVTKARCPAMDGLEEIKPGARWFIPVRDWLSDGAPAPAFLEDPTKAAGVRSYLAKGGIVGEPQDALIAEWHQKRLGRDACLAKANEAIAAAKQAAAAQQKAPDQAPPPAASAPTSTAEAPVTPSPPPAQDAPPAPAASTDTRSEHERKADELFAPDKDNKAPAAAAAPEWAGEVWTILGDAKLPDDLITNVITVLREHHSSRSEAMVCARAVVKEAKTKKDIPAQQDYWGQLAREARGETTESAADSGETVPF
ncbi:MAG: ATP-binding protein [Anaerolineae bacterium]